MRVRKVKDIQKVLKKKGFILNPDKNDHKFYYLHINGKKQSIFTYISHGQHEYGKNLMSRIKIQLKFPDQQTAEDFFNCPMSGEQYVAMLQNAENI